MQIAFYRVAQEALNNIFKHAEATSIDVRLDYDSDHVEMTITDNGCGFDPDCVSAESLGLKIMRERAEGIGAVFAVASSLEDGTRVSLRWSAGDRQ
ncbi:MAG: ATP-binding protein [Anaerolineae bacterium]